MVAERRRGGGGFLGGGGGCTKYMFFFVLAVVCGESADLGGVCCDTGGGWRGGRLGCTIISVCYPLFRIWQFCSVRFMYTRLLNYHIFVCKLCVRVLVRVRVLFFFHGYVARSPRGDVLCWYERTAAAQRSTRESTILSWEYNKNINDLGSTGNRNILHATRLLLLLPSKAGVDTAVWLTRLKHTPVFFVQVISSLDRFQVNSVGSFHVEVIQVVNQEHSVLVLLCGAIYVPGG